MKYFIFFTALFCIACSKEDSIVDPVVSPYVIEIASNYSTKISNPKIAIVDKSFVIEFDYNGTIEVPNSINDTFMEYYDVRQHKVVPAPYPDMYGNDDLISGHNKFIYLTDKAGFDFYNQQYSVVTAFRKNNSGAITYLSHFDFTIKKK